MKFLSCICASLISLFAAPSFAAEQPFAWPESYASTSLETSKFDKTVHFVNRFYTNGEFSRNENEKFGVSVTRPDKGKEYTLKPDGSVVVRRELPKDIPADQFPKSYFYPKDGVWTKLGEETLNGQRAIKYKVDDQYRSVLFWLSADNKTPLRYEEGNAIVEFSEYKPGIQDTKLFEVPGI